jgi:hypothetical protein
MTQRPCGLNVNASLKNALLLPYLVHAAARTAVHPYSKLWGHGARLVSSLLAAGILRPPRGICDLGDATLPPRPRAAANSTDPSLSQSDEGRLLAPSGCAQSEGAARLLLSGLLQKKRWECAPLPPAVGRAWSVPPQALWTTKKWNLIVRPRVRQPWVLQEARPRRRRLSQLHRPPPSCSRVAAKRCGG